LVAATSGAQRSRNRPNPDARFPEILVTVSDFQSLMRPCLAVHEDGQPYTSAALRDRIAELMQVTDEDRAVLLPSGSQPLFTNRVAWAVTHLAQAGLLERPSRGMTQITVRGQEVLQRCPA
jgi:restriction system protein